MTQLFFAQRIQRAYLLRQNDAGSKPAARQFGADDQESIRCNDGSCTEHRPEILRQCLTTRRTQVLHIALPHSSITIQSSVTRKLQNSKLVDDQMNKNNSSNWT